MQEKITRVIDKMNLSKDCSMKLKELIPEAIAKSQQISQKEIEKIKSDLGEERLHELSNILSQIK